MVKRLTAEEARDRVAELEDRLKDFRAVRVQGGHIPVRWVAYPNGAVGLDAVGNITEILMDTGHILESE